MRDGRTYRFQGWSDGGARNHQITVPPGSPQYTATYQAEGVDTLVFSPVADTHVDNLAPSTSYGSLDHVELDADPHMRQGLLKFDLNGLDGRQVLGARLAMRQVDWANGSADGGDVHALSSNSWAESTTWATKPALGAKLASIGPVVSARRYEADLGAAAVDGDGLLSVGMRTSNAADSGHWSSRESANPPQLIVEVARYACSDGEDNDGDGNGDFPADLGCLSGMDNDENSPPVAAASASPTSGDAPLVVEFSSAGSGDPDDSLDYEWDFGDGTAHSAAANPGHSYGGAGTYRATLTVSDEHGSTASDTVQIIVVAPVDEQSSGGSSDGPAPSTSPSLLPLTDPILPPPFTGAGVKKRRAMVRRGAVSLVLSCPSDAAMFCRGGVSLTHRFRAAQSSAAAAKTVRLGNAKFSIASGKAGRVRVKLSSAGRRILAGRRRLKVNVKTTARDSLSRKRTTKSWVMLEMPARRSR